MTWGGMPVQMPGSLRDTGPLRVCSKCALKKSTKGGCDVSRTKWKCGQCWRHQMLRRKA